MGDSFEQIENVFDGGVLIGGFGSFLFNHFGYYFVVEDDHVNIGEVILTYFFPCHDSYQLEDTMLSSDSDQLLFNVSLYSE